MVRPMRTPTSRCVTTCASDGTAQAATRAAAKPARMDMNEPPHCRRRGGAVASRVAAGARWRERTRPALLIAINGVNVLETCAYGGPPLNLRRLFAIRARNRRAGETGRWAIPPAIANVPTRLRKRMTDQGFTDV